MVFYGADIFEKYSPSFVSHCLYLGLSPVSSWLDSGYTFHPEYHVDDVMSFSGYHIWRHIGDVNFYHLVRLFWDYSRVTIFSHGTNKQSVGKHLKIIQMSSWSSSKFLPRFSIYWWFFPGTVLSIMVANCWFASSSPPSSQRQHSDVRRNCAEGRDDLHLTLEQCGFKLCGSTYMWIFPL